MIAPLLIALSLGGVAVGHSVLDAVKTLGTPGIVRTEDWGNTWQWPDTGGFDREVLTDDSMIVESVLVAPRSQPNHASPAPITEPPEAPILGLGADAARTIIAGAGGELVDGRYPDSLAWRLHGGYLVATFNGPTIARIQAFDDATAHRLGYVEPPADTPAHRAPQIEQEFMPPVPMGSGTVIIRVALDAHGGVTDAKIVVSSGNRYIDAAELLHAEKTTYRPALCAGDPCAGVFMDEGWFWSGD